MMLKKLTPNLMVEDVNRTVEFYQTVLDFQLVMAIVDGSQDVLTTLPTEQDAAYALMKRDSIEVMFQSRASLSEDLPVFQDLQNIGGSFTLYIEVEDIKGLYAQVSEHASLVKDIQTTWYGMQEFYIRDCNGYLVAFAENTMQ